MKIETTSLEGVKVVCPTVFEDGRGYFFESFKTTVFKDAGLPHEFVQDNEAKSEKGVLRGLHYQMENPQGKLIRVVSGSILDVAVDIRVGSPTFGKYESEILNSDNKKMLYVPEGFAHGYLVLSDEAIVTYKCTDIYNPNDQYGVRWNDFKLNIDWNIDKPNLSEKDKNLPTLDEQQHLPVF